MNALVLVGRESFDMSDKLLQHGRMVERARQNRDLAVAKAQGLATPVQGDMFQTLTESVPHAMVRSALFTANRKGERAHYIEAEHVYSFRNYDISREGPELRQFDFEVWLKILFVYRWLTGNGWDPTGWLRFKGSAMLKALGTNQTVKDYARLSESLKALRTVMLTIRQQRKGQWRNVLGNPHTTGSPDVYNLLYRLKRDDGTKEFFVKVDPDMANLFLPGDYSPLDVIAHQELRPNPLAQHLHAHLASHPGTFKSMRYESLRALTGRTGQVLATFKRDARNALDLLARNHLITSWQDIDNEQFAIKQRPTEKQLQERGLGAADALLVLAGPTLKATAASLSDGLNTGQKRLFESLAGGVGILDDECYGELRAEAVAAGMPDHVLEHFDKLMDENRF